MNREAQAAVTPSEARAQLRQASAAVRQQSSQQAAAVYAEALAAGLPQRVALALAHVYERTFVPPGAP